ncbi:MAG: hypothetical protein EBR30_20195 [Cytophagia bacterium]|nr:hypothetical protein [Cytophagia bacterium]NBW37294.1 hypothetical protein [Cytophagia bacterium]
MSCEPFKNCSEFTSDKRATVTCSDKKSSTTYIYNNPNSDRLSKYRVDGCLINDNSAKCDYLLLNCDKSKSYFIELKGSDLIRAVEQIDRSIDLLEHALADYSVSARIVVTRVNTLDLKNTKYIKLERKVKNLNGDLKKQSRQMTEQD